ncbi:LTA synthase family protein [Clostridium tarantellae]|uniref:Sulfatase-like hydrolase/transferase n=1 Tax=Clostridium tarantellae TaxID=39493 RepID=A0A6I1MHF7_9CLOT|nr:LTA synthase family protein [Clostridium tarantellae]MPQ42590.1 sulfatase-like hydrolase/transferase [Clostridium tarantellae]
MKKMLKNFVKDNWLFIVMVAIIQFKSTILLGMLRTSGSLTFDYSRAYFMKPPIWAHIAVITLIFSFMYLFKEKGRYRYALIVDFIISLLFLVDIMYYRANTNFISIRHLLHPEIFNPTGKSLWNFSFTDIYFFVDFIVAFLIWKFTKIKYIKTVISKKCRILSFTVVFLISAFTVGFTHYYIDIKGNNDNYNFFRIAWAPFQTYGDMSPLGFHFYDLYYYGTKHKTLDPQEVEEIQSWINENKEDIPDNEYKGMYKGKNVIAVQVESLENFVLNEKVYGQEITPNLNRLMKNSLYFNNFYEQNNSGTSSDADLLVNTSVFPIREGSTFFTYPWTTYNTLQMILSKEGYNSISTHAEIPGNWNWSEAHKAFKAKTVWDESSFNLDEKIGLGLSDGSYMKQISEKIKNEKDPFYLFFPTLTSHGPFEMPEDKKFLKLPKELDENILGAYFQSIRYTDEMIGNFIETLKKNGQLDNTVVMIYGDHCGVHKFYDEETQQAPLEGDWWRDNHKKVPLLIYNPFTKGTVIEKNGGKVDILPTILYLLGNDRNVFDNTSMGRVLVNTNKDSTILNNGEIKGNPTEEEEVHWNKAFHVADLIIEGNYFKNYGQ